MPKLKSRSSAVKRFKITGTGKIVHYHAKRRHNQSNRSKKLLRQSKGSSVAKYEVAKIIKKYFF